MQDRWNPPWTDHDVSDPGVTLLEALAYSLGALAVGVAVAITWRRRRHRCAGTV